MRTTRTFAIAAAVGVASGAVLRPEDAVHLDNAYFRSAKTGFTGLGYIDFGSKPGTLDNGGTARWSYEASKTGNYKICARHAGSMRKAQLLVDNLYHAYDLPLEPTGAWSKWVKTCTNVHMDEGAHHLYLHSATGNAIVDKVTVKWRPILAADTRTDLIHTVDANGQHINTGLSAHHGHVAQFEAGAAVCSHITCKHKLHGDFGMTSIRVKHHCHDGRVKKWGGRDCAETICQMGHFCGMDGNNGCKCVQLLHAGQAQEEPCMMVDCMQGWNLVGDDERGCGGTCEKVFECQHGTTVNGECGECDWMHFKASATSCQQASTDTEYAQALDNEQLALKSAHGKWLVAEVGGGANANRGEVRSWETWTLKWNGGTSVSFKGAHNKYLVAETNGDANANRVALGSWEKFTFDHVGNNKITLKGAHGKYLVAEPNGDLNANRGAVGSWEKFRVHEVAFGGSCANGVLAEPADRTQANHCGDCDSGYELVNKACQAYGGTCTNGVLAAQAARTQQNHCADCDWLFFLNSNKSCQAASTDTQYAQALDNQRLALKSAHGKYLVAESDGKANANRGAVGSWEIWTLKWNGGTSVSFKGAHNKYLVAETNGDANADRAALGSWEKFTFDHVGNNKITLKGAHGKYLVAEPNGDLNANRGAAGSWEKFKVYEK